MKLILGIMCGFSLTAGLPFPKVQAQEVATEIDPVLQAKVDEIARLGTRIYLHDQAAWHGTDALAAKVNISRQKQLRGYLTEELENGNIALIFYAEYDEAFFEFARYEVKESEVVAGGINADPRNYPLGAVQLRQIAAKEVAIDAAIEKSIQLCADPPINTVILPPDGADQIAVYLLTAKKDNESYPLGGHHRFMVDSQNKVVGYRPFMKSCMSVPVPGTTNDPVGGRLPEGSKLVNFTVSHILDSHPTEIHYFVRQYTVPISVVAGGTVWLVD